MSIGVRLGACTILTAAWLACWGADVATAEPSKPCLDLALRFATAPEQLDIKSLARLGNCATTEIEARLGGTESSAVPGVEASPSATPPANPSPPPAPPAGSSPQPRTLPGIWPPPAPWTEGWPAQSPWDK